MNALPLLLALALAAQQAPAFRYEPSFQAEPGTIVYAHLHPTHGTWITPNLFDLRKLMRLIQASDPLSRMEMEDAGDLLLVPEGTPLRVLQLMDANVIGAASYEVRILDGKYKDKKAWVAREWVAERVLIAPEAAPEKPAKSTPLATQQAPAFRYELSLHAEPGTILYTQTSERVWIVPNLFDFRKLIRVIQASDPLSIEEMENSGDVLAVPNGIPVRVLQSMDEDVTGAASYEVRILDGKYKDKKGWVARAFVAERVAITPEKTKTVAPEKAETKPTRKPKLTEAERKEQIRKNLAKTRQAIQKD